MFCHTLCYNCVQVTTSYPLVYHLAPHKQKCNQYSHRWPKLLHKKRNYAHRFEVSNKKLIAQQTDLPPPINNILTPPKQSTTCVGYTYKNVANCRNCATRLPSLTLAKTATKHTKQGMGRGKTHTSSYPQKQIPSLWLRTSTDLSSIDPTTRHTLICIMCTVVAVHIM